MLVSPIYFDLRALLHDLLSINAPGTPIIALNFEFFSVLLLFGRSFIFYYVSCIMKRELLKRKQINILIPGFVHIFVGKVNLFKFFFQNFQWQRHIVEVTNKSCQISEKLSSSSKLSINVSIQEWTK